LLTCNTGSSHTLPEFYPQVWDILHDPQHRKEILEDNDQCFLGLKSLDPVRMSVSDVFTTLNIIKSLEDNGRSVLTFTVPDDLGAFQVPHETPSDNEIVELDDPPNSKSRRTGPPSQSDLIEVESPGKPSSYEVPDFSPEEPATRRSKKPSPVHAESPLTMQQSAETSTSHPLKPAGAISAVMPKSTSSTMAPKSTDPKDCDGAKQRKKRKAQAPDGNSNKPAPQKRKHNLPPPRVQSSR